MDWQIIAAAFAAVAATLLGIIWGRVAGDLARVTDKLAEVAILLHGHGIRIDQLEGRHDARQ